MPKNIVQDIMIKRVNERTSDKEPKVSQKKPVKRKTRRSKLKIPKKIIVGILILAVIAIGFLSLSSRVVISIVPKQQSVQVDFDKKTFKDEGEVAYTVITLEETQDMGIPSTGTKEVDKRASGKILIFNKYSSSPQRLIARTRFEAPDGKIFRISDPVIIPGYKKEGGNIIPGSIEAVVYADEPGEEYNIGFSDFTIPGLKGTPLYDGFFARSKNEIKGGFSGLMKVVSDEDVTKARQTLEENLIKSLRTKVEEKIVTEERIAFENASFIIFTEDVASDADTAEESTDDATFILHARLHIMLFDKIKLNDAIVNEYLPEENAELVEVSNLESLEVTLPDKDLVSITDDETAFIHIKGTALFKWRFSSDEIKTRLLGAEKDDLVFNTVFREHFPNIVSADVVSFRPFWAQRFPDDPDNIIIKEAAADGS